MIQAFPVSGYFYGGIAFWLDPETGELKISDRDSFTVGDRCAQKDAEVAETQRAYVKARDAFLMKRLAETNDICPFKPGDLAYLKKPYNRMRAFSVKTVCGFLPRNYDSEEEARYALIGNMCKKDGSIGDRMILADESEIAVSGRISEDQV